MFKTFETLATFDPDLMAGLIQAGKQALIQLEQKRGVGADMQLRSVFRGIKSVVFVRLVPSQIGVVNCVSCGRFFVLRIIYWTKSAFCSLVLDKVISL